MVIKEIASIPKSNFLNNVGASTVPALIMQDLILESDSYRVAPKLAPQPEPIDWNLQFHSVEELELELEAELDAELEETELETELELLFTTPEIVVVEKAPDLVSKDTTDNNLVDKLALKFNADTPSLARQQEKNSWLIDLVDMHSIKI